MNLLDHYVEQLNMLFEIDNTQLLVFSFQFSSNCSIMCVVVFWCYMYNILWHINLSLALVYIAKLTHSVSITISREAGAVYLFSIVFSVLTTTLPQW